MITSASGWRKVFAVSGDETDTTTDIGEENKTLAALAADTFADYITARKNAPSVILGIDTRPTGPQIADQMLRVLMSRKIAVSYAGIIAAPEIMAYSRTADAFIYISASHNPVGHNGIKFGLNDGGVLNGTENAKLVEGFNRRCNSTDEIKRIKKLAQECEPEDLDWVITESIAVMREASSIYRSFAKQVISGTDNISKQNKLFAQIRQNVLSNPVGIVADMNGSARTLSIDSDFFKECGISFYGLNNVPGKIVHAIIPEAENLIWCAAEMERLQEEGHTDVKLGYMPDCDGDRGNIVFWNEQEKEAQVLQAQEVFAISVLAELAYATYWKGIDKEENVKLAVSVNGPTSMRIEEIAKAFDAEVFRAEVGEANVVNLAREKRDQGYVVRILGEGSNGGNITHPAAVRDPLNTIFALIKLLVMRDAVYDDGKVVKGLFHLWCSLSGQEDKYRDDFTLLDVLKTLPAYTTTGVAEERAVLHITTTDHSKLKANFQKIFENQWQIQKDALKSKYGIESYEAIATNGIKETRNLSDYSKSAKGGLKILFYNAEKEPVAFIWMRGSGTEPVFRVMCDVKGTNTEMEKKLLEWETKMILRADQL
ncbi:MAG: phosphoglucomutase [Treponema sp.]|nr:phosphoglucomutase [Candidatus Treponema equifaecale]